jgi:hypothetical protein
MSEVLHAYLVLAISEVHVLNTVIEHDADVAVPDVGLASDVGENAVAWEAGLRASGLRDAGGIGVGTVLYTILIGLVSSNVLAIELSWRGAFNLRILGSIARALLALLGLGLDELLELHVVGGIVRGGGSMSRDVFLRYAGSESRRTR